LRVYDKALESGTGEVGSWVRWELELSDTCAVAALESVASDEWEAALLGLAFGCVDFRENTGDQHIERRSRVAWWRDFIGIVPTRRVTAERQRPTLDGWLGWVRTAVLPGVLGAALMLGLGVDELVRTVGKDVQASASFVDTPVGRGLWERFERQAVACDGADVDLTEWDGEVCRA